ncbi:hypothetical protein LguiB_017753 [Lonicera macranthoides]
MHARTMGYKVVFTDHSLYGFADAGSIHMNKVLQFTLADVTEAIYVSHTSKENTVLRSGLPPEKVFVIPNAVDTAMFRPAPQRLGSDEIIILVISRCRLVYRKGADLLVENIPEVCRLRWGLKELRLEDMREKHSLQDRVDMLGAIPHAKECLLFGILEQERARYINRVNKILNSHKGAIIEELKIEFDLRLNDRLDIDSWINFAIRKKVRRLDLKLEPVNIVPVPVDWEGDYPFPVVQCLGNNSLNISCLTSLNLNFVNMTDEVLEYLLSSCPSLEFVRILNSPSLEGVRVLDPCPKLKHLEITHCYNLAFLDISSAPSLASLSYSGPQDTTLCFRNVPNLSDVSLGSFYGKLKVERFNELPIAIS